MTSLSKIQELSSEWRVKFSTNEIKEKIAEHDDEEERNLLTWKSILVASSELAQYFKNHPMLAPKFKRGYWTEIKEMKMNVQNNSQTSIYADQKQ